MVLDGQDKKREAMRYLLELSSRPWRITFPLLALLLVLTVACGSTAQPADQQAAASPAVQTPVVAATAAAPTTVAQPTPAPQEATVQPGKVTLLTEQFGTERFDPVFGTIGVDYSRQFHGFLISSDVKDGRMVVTPGIATEWEISSDALTWTFTIRDGVKFHDGTDLTAEDVLWSLRHFMGPQALEYSKSTTSVFYSGIMDRIERTGPDQVSVTTKEPIPGLPGDISQGSGGYSGSIVFPKRATLHNKKEEEAYDSNPIGAGIIKLMKHIPLQAMTFERFDDYYHQPENGFPDDRRLNFTELDLQLVPEEATRAAALQSGEGDMGRISLGTRQQVEAGGGRLVFSPEARAFQIELQGCREPHPCHDKRVRQALSYAIDKELMRDELYGPEVMQVKGWWVVTPSTIGYSPDLDPHPYDPDKARQLLAEAGYPGGEGFGKLIVNTSDSPFIPFLPESAQLAAEFWRRELGLDVEVRLLDDTTMSRDMATRAEIFDGQINWEDNDARLDANVIVQRRYHLYGGEPGGRLRHNDPELHGVAEQVRDAIGQAEEETILNSAYQRLWEEDYHLPIGYINIPWGVGPHIAAWQPYPVAEYASALHTITLK
jgi:peptide/nickel transport system substrate-binding protein